MTITVTLHAWERDDCNGSENNWDGSENNCNGSENNCNGIAKITATTVYNCTFL